MKSLLISALVALSFTLPQRLYPDVVASDENERTAEYVVSARDAHSRVLERVQWSTNEVGEVSGITNSYVELRTGMHFKNEVGEFVESDSSIEIYSGRRIGAQSGLPGPLYP